MKIWGISTFLTTGGRAGAAGYMQSLKINKMKQFTQFRQTSSKVITLKQTQTGHIV